jgi:glutamate-1-semialdehyde 2,1-aminomutase
MRIAYVIGTFAAHPVVMGAMNEFLHWVRQPATATLYNEANHHCQQWAEATNQQLADAALPLRVVHLATVWTVLFKAPSRYNWLLQYYLRAEGVMLSWVGTGRCLSSLDYTEEDYDELQMKLLNAAHKMKRDGWWLHEKEQPGRDARMRVRLMWEILGSLVRVPKPLQSFYAEVMRRKKDDHHASHSNVVNQLFHLLSSSAFIFCYALVFLDFTKAMWFGLAALFIRQIGHAVLEPPCHDKEELLLGFNTRLKTLIVAVYLVIPVLHVIEAGSLTGDAFTSMTAQVAQQWFLWTLVVVLGRVAYLVWEHNVRISMIWFVKLITDPFTDIIAYSPRALSVYKAWRPLRARQSDEP